MFQVGEKYILHREVNGSEIEEWNRIVLDFNEKTGLLKVQCGEKIEIINTTSPNFSSAEIQK